MKFFDKWIARRKAYQDLQAKHQDAVTAMEKLQSERNALRREVNSLNEVKERIDEVVEKMFAVTAKHDYTRNRFRFCVDMDGHLIHDALIHGADDSLINHFGERIGFMAAQKIRQLNFERW